MGRGRPHLTHRVCDERAPPLLQDFDLRNLSMGVEVVAEVVWRDRIGQPTDPQRAHSLILGGGQLGDTLRSLEILLRELIILQGEGVGGEGIEGGMRWGKRWVRGEVGVGVRGGIWGGLWGGVRGGVRSGVR